MRQDRKGEVHTLDMDISDLWKSHGWIVEKIVIPGRRRRASAPSGAHTWIVKADVKPQETTKIE